LEAKLSGDEFDALELLRRGPKSVRANACVGRNAKKLSGLKLVKIDRGDMAALTDKGTEVLFLRRCVNALRALSADPAGTVDADVAAFLMRKSHIVERAEGGFEVTARGRESLADIDR
jgi:predicted methyltransferase